MMAEWAAWNAGMLPQTEESYTVSFTRDQLAGHIGAPKATGKADNSAKIP